MRAVLDNTYVWSVCIKGSEWKLVSLYTYNRANRGGVNGALDERLTTQILPYFLGFPHFVSSQR